MLSNQSIIGCNQRITNWNDQSSWWLNRRFISEFGTHYATTSKIGTKITIERRYSARERAQADKVGASKHELVTIDNVMLERAEELRKQHRSSAGRPPDWGGQERVRQQGRAVQRDGKLHGREDCSLHLRHVPGRESGGVEWASTRPR